MRPAAGYPPVSRPDRLGMVAAAVEESAIVGLDVETTGLDPRTDRVRLLSLDCDTTDGGRFTYLVDCFAVDPRPLWEALADRPIVAHNAAFDLGFLAALGFHPAGPVHDTMLLSQLLHGTRRPKGFHGLAQTAGRELGRPLDKTDQKSDWSGELTAEQLRLRRRGRGGAAAPVPTAVRQDQGRRPGPRRRDRRPVALPAVAWMGRQGVAFDRAAWDALAREAAAEAEALARRLDATAPDRPGRLIREAAWNWSVPEQVKEAFAALGVALESTDDDALAAVDHPLAQLLRDYRSAAKLASTYGAGLVRRRPARRPRVRRLASDRRRLRPHGVRDAEPPKPPPRPALPPLLRRPARPRPCESGLFANRIADRRQDRRATRPCWTPTAAARTCTPRRPGRCWAKRRDARSTAAGQGR